MRSGNVLGIVAFAVISMTPISLVAEDVWTTNADMPTPRAAISTSVVDGIIYAIGGTRSQTGWALSTVEAYDPATDTWTTKSPMPSPRVFFSTSVVNGKIYAIGGDPGPEWGGPVSTVEELTVGLPPPRRAGRRIMP